MEDFSDPGYGYLGELLASRGFIFVSVDENFFNSSLADLADIFGPGLEEENDARGWLLLEHLAQWSDWNVDPEHLFSGKVDMDRVALIGHSRGGEAVVVAAALNKLRRYPDDATLAFDYRFNIRGVIAIAPADGQYEPRGRGTPLQDVNYFTIHGSLDGDVQSFMGSSQYSRVELTHDPTGENFHFKSTLYVLDVNHGQFNTSWGRNDFGGFWGMSLDTRPIMDPEEQRLIARVYFSAFLEVVLRENRAYLPIFSDARRAAAWLPDTFYLHDYADSLDVVVAGFDEDLDPTDAAQRAHRGGTPDEMARAVDFAEVESAGYARRGGGLGRKGGGGDRKLERNVAGGCGRDRAAESAGLFAVGSGRNNVAGKLGRGERGRG
jgi:hypothetical protein